VGVTSMVKPKDLEKYRAAIEEALVALGRDDVGVGEVKASSENTLSVTLSRGTHNYAVDLPVEKLNDRGTAHATLSAAILGLSKEVAHESMDKAQLR
jgi:hypothetical protein